jgi:hypothetical protein
MTTYLVHRSDQVGSVAQAARAFLESRPVEHNLILSLLRDRVARPEPGRYWWITENGLVRGVALQSPLTFRAAMTPVPPDAVGPLVDAVAADAPTLPGVGGEAATAAAFAGAWTERFGSGATPVEGQRLYELDTVVEPTGVGGALRPAGPDDVALAGDWFEAFDAETASGPGGPGLRSVVAARVAAGEVWLWEHDGEVVSSAMVSRPICGAGRIGFVYTPPVHRGHGYAAATVARLCALALGDLQPFGPMVTCLLYTQLGNATSNRVYRRIGFRSVAEALVYRFGD